MDLDNAGRRKIAFDEGQSVQRCEANVGQPALVGPACGIAQHQRQYIDAQVIVVASPDGAAEQESAIAAADVDDQGG